MKKAKQILLLSFISITTILLKFNYVSASDSNYLFCEYDNGGNTTIELSIKRDQNKKYDVKAYVNNKSSYQRDEEEIRNFSDDKIEDFLNNDFNCPNQILFTISSFFKAYDVFLGSNDVLEKIANQNSGREIFWMKQRTKNFSSYERCEYNNVTYKYTDENQKTVTSQDKFKFIVPLEGPNKHTISWENGDRNYEKMKYLKKIISPNDQRNGMSTLAESLIDPYFNISMYFSHNSPNTNNFEKAYQDSGNKCPNLYSQVRSNVGIVFTFTNEATNQFFGADGNYFGDISSFEGKIEGIKKKPEENQVQEHIQIKYLNKQNFHNNKLPLTKLTFKMDSNKTRTLCVNINEEETCHSITNDNLNKFKDSNTPDDKGQYYKAAIATKKSYTGSDGITYSLIFGIDPYYMERIFKVYDNNYKFNLPASIYLYEAQGSSYGDLGFMLSDEKKNISLSLSDDIKGSAAITEDQINIGFGSIDKTCGKLSYGLIKFGYGILDFIKIVGVMLVIILGSLDFVKATTSGDADANKKAMKNFRNRLIAAVSLFILPVLIKFILINFQVQGTDPTDPLCEKYENRSNVDNRIS